MYEMFKNETVSVRIPPLSKSASLPQGYRGLSNGLLVQFPKSFIKKISQEICFGVVVLLKRQSSRLIRFLG